MGTNGSLHNQQLKSLVERIERLEEEKKALTTDINEVHAEAKAFGFDTKIMKKVVKLRAMDPEDRAEEAELIRTYMLALGMTPLEEAIEASKLRDAVKEMGGPVEMTEAEKAAGGIAAFEKGGNRMSIAVGGGKKKRRADKTAQPSA